MREAPERYAVVAAKAQCRVATTYSRRHIDLQRVAAALCPAYAYALVQLVITPYTAA